MKQLIQNIRTGESEVVDVPAPGAGRGSILVRVAASLVSAGTERMIAGFAGMNLLEKARSRPDLVRQTIEKAKRDGILPTIEAVQNRLDQPMPLGYSIAGTVIEVGEGAERFRIGQRVAAAGANQAVHAEMVSVPVNLAVAIPDSVSFESAAFTTIGAIALQGIRLADPKLGDVVAVIGLGLLGQLTLQLLRANGCRVIGYDLRSDRAALASMGRPEGRHLHPEVTASSDADSFRSACAAATAGHGVDSVLITADTSSDEPIALAGEVARQRAVVVAVGAVGMHVPRKTYYEKELELRVSRSYGPGRYDDQYEKLGIDYPYGYVRWTENRNMEAFVRMLDQERVDVRPLITHRFSIDDAGRASDLLRGESGESFLGIVLEYPPREEAASRRIDLVQRKTAVPAAQARIGVLGAGAFANSVLLPAFRAGGASLIGIAAATGLSARHAAGKFDFQFCTTDDEEIIHSPQVNAVVIATRHNLHASQALRALRAGKHVFVEKPLCLTAEELDDIRSTHEGMASSLVLMVGFNRRYAPMSLRMADHFRGVDEPLMIHYRVNAGFVPSSEWIQTLEGGGRLIGEGVHCIDWGIWLANDVPETIHAVAAGNAGKYRDDNLSVTIRFRRGSVFQLTYIASGDRAVGKERIEVHGGGRSAVLDDFRRVEVSSRGRRQVHRSRLRADKGHQAEAVRFIRAVEGKAPATPFEELDVTMRATFAAVQSLATGAPVMFGG